MAPKRIPPLKAPPNERPNWERTTICSHCSYRTSG
uniref:Structural protein n=1 Tax=Planococcus citri densovirus TaxID=159153 RepID=A0A218L3N0_9VIRU|nr:structural protein [Planococcus citri densovirus]